MGTAASLLESWARIQSRRERQRSDEPTQLADQRTANQHRALAQQTRRELAVGQPDSQFWLTRSHEEVLNRVRAADLDPYRMGERSHDVAWTRRAPSRDVRDLLAAADMYADRSEVAASVRDNIGDELRDYGLDPDELLKADPAVAADQITDARGTHRAGHDPDPSLGYERDNDDGEVQRAQTADQHGLHPRDGDGVSVAALLSQAQAADREAADNLMRSEQATEQATAASAQQDTRPASRAERVVAADREGTPAGQAAAIAAQSHPTNPGEATRGPTKSAGRARSGGAARRARTTSDPQRTHRGR